MADRRRKPLKPPGRRPTSRKPAQVKAEPSAKAAAAAVAFAIPPEVRKSSRASAVGAAQRLLVVQGERERERVRRQAQQQRRLANSVPAVRPSQEAMLVEAAQTEQVNKLSLQLLLEREERQRQKLEGRGRYMGPVLRQRSARDDRGEEVTTIAFRQGAYFTQRTALPGGTSDGQSRERQCAVFGVSAPYLDPVTGLPYSSAEAFKILRQRHAERKKNHRKRASTEPGEDSAFGDSPEPKVGKLTLKVKASGPDTGGKAAQTGGSAARRLPQLPLPSGQAPKLLHNLAAPQ